MLYRKTTTAISAVILGVVALLGATAHAVDLNHVATPTNPFPTTVFSKETLPRPTSARQTHHAVMVAQASSTALEIRSALGTLVPRVAAGTDLRPDAFGGTAVRYDLTNIQWARALTADNLGVFRADGTPLTNDPSNVPRGLRAGGTATAGTSPNCNGRTCAIFEIAADDSLSTGGTDLLPDTRLAMQGWDGLLAVHRDGGGMARVRVYRNFDDALAAGSTGLRSDTGARPMIDVRSSVTTTLTAGAPAVADVAADPRFTNFSPAGAQRLGVISIALNAMHYKASGTMMELDLNTRVGALGDVMNTTDSGIAFTDTTQNLGFGTFYLGPAAAAGTAPTCAAAGAAGVSVASEGENIGRGAAAVFSGTRALCVAPRRPVDPATMRTARTGPNQEIPATAITATVSYAEVTGNAFAAAGMTRPIGSIVRNGASAQLGYLTVSDRYNQRIIITNRSMADAEYELTNFYTEDGTEASGGEDVMGVVPAETSIVVLTRDAVQFTGSRARGSATLAVTAPAASVSVATTQVNLSDGSTDTVNYDVTGAGQ